jgi:hypothetical protein
MASAQAGGTPTVTVINKTVLAPYQLAFTKGALYTSDGGSSTVNRLVGKKLKVLAKGAKGSDLSGVAVNENGDLAYTSTIFAGEGAVKSSLTIKTAAGKTVVANLLKYEKVVNPDADVRYGIDHPTKCQKKAFKPLGGATYHGLVDSHPYAVTPLGAHGWVVADAAGNDLLKVSKTGHISTLSVLPRQATVITPEAAKALGLPDCVVGAVYNFEPVPTDLELSGHDLIVSLLPGGPEDPSLGARGKVYRVDATCGLAYPVASGFLGATNVAVAPDGRIFVAELFGNTISVITGGKSSTYLKLPNVVSLAWGDGVLYAGTLGPSDDQGNPTGPGSLVAIT